MVIYGGTYINTGTIVANGGSGGIGGTGPGGTGFSGGVGGAAAGVDAARLVRRNTDYRCSVAVSGSVNSARTRF